MRTFFRYARDFQEVKRQLVETGAVYLKRAELGRAKIAKKGLWGLDGLAWGGGGARLLARLCWTRVGRVYTSSAAYAWRLASCLLHPPSPFVPFHIAPFPFSIRASCVLDPCPSLLLPPSSASPPYFDVRFFVPTPPSLPSRVLPLCYFSPLCWLSSRIYATRQSPLTLWGVLQEFSL
jgi:hypothetical protein